MSDTISMQLNRFESCLICSASNFTFLKGYEKDQLVRCDTCGFVFCHQKPTTEELIDHYKQYPRERTISDITLTRYNTLLDKLEKYRKTNNIIDVGCGDGFFLVEAKKRNWNVFGTEFRADAISSCECQGIQMTTSPLNFKYYPENHFDVITSFEVIEHINNPIEELHHFDKILRCGGVVYVTTPNFNSISRHFLGSKWNVIQYPEHLCYYTKSTLTMLFKSATFKVLEIKTIGVSVTRLKDSLGIVTLPSGTADGESGTIDETIRKMAEDKTFFRIMKLVINYSLNLFKVGDAMHALFQKQ